MEARVHASSSEQNGVHVRVYGLHRLLTSKASWPNTNTDTRASPDRSGNDHRQFSMRRPEADTAEARRTTCAMDVAGFVRA